MFKTGGHVDVARFPDHILIKSGDLDYIAGGDNGSLAVVKRGALVQPIGIVIRKPPREHCVLGVVSPRGTIFAAFTGEGITTLVRISHVK